MSERVFVSSVIKGFEEYREAARRGIEDAGGEPVLVNEDFPALATSSRNACLDGVISSDIYLVIVGERGGWRAPSGKLVVEEEYEQARKSKKPILAFIQDVEHDMDANQLINELSDYVNGFFRPTFKTIEELRSQVAKALAPMIREEKVPQARVAMIQEKLNERFQIPHESRLRFVLAPERDEEVVDVVSLDSEELKRSLYEIGHSHNVGLFAYEYPKTAKVKVSSLEITQGESSGRQHSDKVVHLELSSEGVITIDANVTGRVKRGSFPSSMEGFVIVEADVIECLKSSFAFANAFYNKQDPYKRHHRFFYNAALGDIEYRKLVSEFKEKSSITMENDRRGVIPAFDKAKLISREDLNSPTNEINALMTMFRRRLSQ